MNPWITGAALLYLGGSYVWRKLHEKSMPPPSPERVRLPRTDEGAPIPIVYGRTKVTSPILAWAGKQFALWVPDDTGDVNGSFQQLPERFLYFRNLHFVIGIPMGDGAGTSRLHEMWLGSQRLGRTGPRFADEMTGDGNFEPDTIHAAWSSIYKPDTIGSPSFMPEREDDASRHIEPFEATAIEFLNGNPNQKVVDDDGTPLTYLGKHMTVRTGTGVTDYTGDADPDEVPSYRGYLSVFLFGNLSSNQLYALLGGPSMQTPAFEVSSYYDLGDYPAPTFYARIGWESNPANVIWDILTSRTKLAIPTSRLDRPSFVSVGYTLWTESHGYSRTFENGETGEEMLGEILEQIHGLLYVDRATGKIKIRLIRNDYDPNTIPVINKTNCDSFELDSTGGDDLPNKIRVTFRNRAKDYETDSVLAQDLANVYASGKVREEVIDYPGVCTPEQAQKLADRDLADLTRPVMTATAIVSRAFHRLVPGDPLKVVWQNPDLAGIVFRVIGIDYGTPENAAIRLDLIQDANYVWRNQSPKPPDHGGFTPPNPPTVILGS